MTTAATSTRTSGPLAPPAPPGPSLTWTWTGELDLGDVPALRATWQRLAGDGPRHVVIDMAAVTFVDCAVLSFLVTVQRQAGCRVVLQAVPAPAARLLRLTGLADLFDVDDLSRGGRDLRDD